MYYSRKESPSLMTLTHLQVSLHCDAGFETTRDVCLEYTSLWLLCCGLSFHTYHQWPGKNRTCDICRKKVIADTFREKITIFLSMCLNNQHNYFFINQPFFVLTFFIHLEHAFIIVFVFAPDTPQYVMLMHFVFVPIIFLEETDQKPQCSLFILYLNLHLYLRMNGIYLSLFLFSRLEHSFLFYRLRLWAALCPNRPKVPWLFVFWFVCAHKCSAFGRSVL